MNRKVLVAIVALAAPVPTLAQGATFGVTGGWYLPYATAPFSSNAGWNIGAVLRLGAPRRPLALRVDATYSDIGTTLSYTVPDAGTLAVSNQIRIWSATGNVVWTIFGNDRPTALYVIGGVGFYYVQQIVEDFPGYALYRNALGYNGGLGFRYDRVFIEARWNSIQSVTNFTAFGSGGGNVEFLPINAGVFF